MRAIVEGEYMDDLEMVQYRRGVYGLRNVSGGRVERSISCIQPEEERDPAQSRDAGLMAGVGAT